MSNLQGTTVPSNAFVEKVYINVDLSIEEVVSIIDSANLTYNFASKYTVVDGIEISNILGKKISVNNEVVFRESDSMNTGAFVGWKEGFNGIVVVNKQNSYGAQNDALSSLFSITPLTPAQDGQVIVSKSKLTAIADNIRNQTGATGLITLDEMAKMKLGGTDTSDATATSEDILLGKTAYVNDVKVVGTIEEYDGSYEGEAAEGGSGVGANLILPGEKVATPIPNTGTVETVYFNTDLSTDEVYSIIESANLTYTDFVYLVLMTNDQSIMIGIQFVEGMCIIVDMATNTFIFHNIPDAEADLGFMGWNPAMSSMAINKEVLSELEGMAVGNENSKIADVLAIKYEYLDGETVELENEYNGIKVTLSENGETSLLPYIQDNNEIPIEVRVNVPLPSGNMNITSNGEYDVYSNATVNVQVTEMEDKLVNGKQINSTVFAYSNSRVGDMNSCVFRENADLESIDLPNMYNIRTYAFENCTALKYVNFPKLVTVNGYLFKGCISLESIDLPEATQLIGYCFAGCTLFSTISIPKVKYIYDNAFQSCPIKKLVLDSVTMLSNMALKDSGIEILVIKQSSSVCLLYSNAFSNTPLASGTGYIYVPDSLVESYKSATNWSTYADQIKPLSELPQEYKDLYNIN